MTNLKPVWIDTDTGVDDAFALITALKLPNIEVKGISAVCGNVECDKTFKNARNVISLAQREDIKVFKGADKPFLVPLHPAYNVHGEDGLGGITIPESKAKVETKNAVDALYECAKELGELYLVPIGPLTNIAACILKYPDFLNYVKEIDLMGGSIGVGGNTTPSAEFNIYGDPHAAQVVFKSGAKINMFGLDVTMKSVLFKDEVEVLKDIHTPVCDFLYKSSKAPMALYKMLGLGEVMCMHDTDPLVYLSNPDLFKGKLAGVYVETKSEISLGRTVSDLYVRADNMFEKNATVMLEVDRERLAKLVIDTFKEY